MVCLVLLVGRCRLGILHPPNHHTCAATRSCSAASSSGLGGGTSGSSSTLLSSVVTCEEERGRWRVEGGARWQDEVEAREESGGSRGSSRPQQRSSCPLHRSAAERLQRLPAGRPPPAHPHSPIHILPTWNISPAPSQSEAVTMGVCTYRNPRSCGRRDGCWRELGSGGGQAAASCCAQDGPGRMQRQQEARYAPRQGDNSSNRSGNSSGSRVCSSSCTTCLEELVGGVGQRVADACHRANRVGAAAKWNDRWRAESPACTPLCCRAGPSAGVLRPIGWRLLSVSRCHPPTLR